MNNLMIGYLDSQLHKFNYVFHNLGEKSRLGGPFKTHLPYRRFEVVIGGRYGGAVGDALRRFRPGVGGPN